MTKYATTRKKEKVKTNQPHYVWRGIGCVMMILIPVISYAAGVETINYAIAHRWTIPIELLGLPRFPDLFYQSSGLMTLLAPIARVKHFYAYATAAAAYAILLGAITSMAYAIVYRMTGPSQYGPLDAPPPKVKVKPYKR